eukprot:11442908-Ditylum_brightwellii.AAC.1
MGVSAAVIITAAYLPNTLAATSFFVASTALNLSGSTGGGVGVELAVGSCGHRDSCHWDAA